MKSPGRPPEPQYVSVQPQKVPEPVFRRLLNPVMLDNLFFGIASVCMVLLAVVIFRQSLRLSPVVLLYLVVFWLVLTYLALPRVHRVLTSLYVPDYFIGRTHTTDGLLGDPVNLALRGDAAQIHTVMSKAGWVLADPINLRSACSEESRSVGLRPPALLFGVILTVLAAVLEATTYAPELVKSLTLVRGEVNSQMWLGIQVAVAVSIGGYYLIEAVLLWLTYLGRSWPRLIVLAMLCFQVSGQLLQWVRLPAGALDAGALLATGLYTLVIYALSSLSVRSWTHRGGLRRP